MKVLDFCDDNGIKVVYEYNEPKKAEVSDTKIQFNGLGNEGHETFGLAKEKPKPNSDSEFFDFCKTARKPYDLAVGLVLLIAKNHAPNSIKISSDGDWDHDWSEIKEAYNNIFDSHPECPFDESLV
jgi:ubiquitin